MNRNVLITIKGLHFDGEDSVPVESVMPGRYYKKDGAHYLLYEEVLSTDTSGTETCNNRCKILPDRVELSKAAPISAKMIFALNENCVTDYNTQFGSLTVGMNTRSIRVHESADMLEVDLVYDLEVNYAHVSECRLSITALNMAESDS